MRALLGDRQREVAVGGKVSNSLRLSSETRELVHHVQIVRRENHVVFEGIRDLAAQFGEHKFLRVQDVAGDAEIVWRKNNPPGRKAGPKEFNTFRDRLIRGKTALRNRADGIVLKKKHLPTIQCGLRKNRVE